MNLQAPEIIVIAIVVLILFGSRKLPDAARSLGRSMRIFKAETRGLRDDVQTPNPEPRPEVRTLPAPAPDSTTADGRPLGAETDRTESR